MKDLVRDTSVVNYLVQLCFICSCEFKVDPTISRQELVHITSLLLAFKCELITINVVPREAIQGSFYAIWHFFWNFRYIVTKFTREGRHFCLDSACRFIRKAWLHPLPSCSCLSRESIGAQFQCVNYASKRSVEVSGIQQIFWFYILSRFYRCCQALCRPSPVQTKPCADLALCRFSISISCNVSRWH